jgi:hypothetical protein
MSTKRPFLAALAVVAAFGSAVARADDYKLNVLAAPGSPQTFAVGISSAGIIAGTYYDSKSATMKSYTYDTRLKHPTFQNFFIAPQHGGTVTSTVISAISLHGDLAGNYSETASGHSKTYGFIYTASGMFTTLDYPGGVQTVASAISSLGTVAAGVYYTPGVPHAFVYNGGYKEISAAGMDDNTGLTPLTVNNSGFVTGGYYDVTRNQNRSFTAAGHTAMDFNPEPGLAGCGINGANPSGTVLVGYCYNPTQALVTVGGVPSLHSAPSASSTVLNAVSVNNLGGGTAVIGPLNVIFETDATVTNYKFAIAPSTWSLISVVGINAAGKLVGRFTDSDGHIKVFWAH